MIEDHVSPAWDAHTVSRQTLDSWADCFSRRDPEAMASLYTDQALFFGSKPVLFQGRRGVQEYFASLSPRRKNSVRVDEIVAVALADDAIALAASAHFQVDDNNPVVMRLSQTLKRVGIRWLVASHHASPFGRA